MLVKLMKYEFKACGRIFFPLYLGILFLGIINGVNLGANSGAEDEFFMNTITLTTQGILFLILVALFIALFVITIILTIQRFKKNLLDDEGYLMFTLPVKSSNLILSKFLVALIYVIISVIVASIAFFIIVTIGGDFKIADLLYMFTSQDIFSEGGASIFYMILSLFIDYIIFILTIYLAISIAQLPKLSKHGVAAGVIFYFLINLVISSIQIFITDNLFNKTGELENIDTLMSMSTDYWLVNLLLNVIIGVILFLLTNWILNKKLNLE